MQLIALSWLWSNNHMQLQLFLQSHSPTLNISICCCWSEKHQILVKLYCIIWNFFWRFGKQLLKLQALAYLTKSKANRSQNLFWELLLKKFKVALSQKLPCISIYTTISYWPTTASSYKQWWYNQMINKLTEETCGLLISRK